MKQNADEMMLGKVSKQTQKINSMNEENKEKGLSSNVDKLFMNVKSDNQKNKMFMGRHNTIISKEKPSGEMNQFFRTDFKSRTTCGTSISNFKKNITEAPQTTLEKIVDIMKKIKDKLNFHNELDLANDAEWVTKELLTNNIYKLKVDDKEGKEENGFYDEYSNIKSEKLFNKDIIKSENQIPLEPPTPMLRSENSHLHNLKFQDLGPEFDLFVYSEKVGRERVLFNVAKPIFTYSDINKFLKLSKFQDYINEIRIGYTMNPNSIYHSVLEDYHAADVLQTTFYFCYKCKFDEVLGLEGIDILSLLFSALIHDFKHPGYTNLFMNNSSSEISYTYNDKSPLENFHVAEAFALTKKKNLSIFEKIKIELFKVLRKRTIECVLATDMALHSKHIGQISSKLDYFSQAPEGSSFIEFFTDEKNNISKFDLQQEFMNFILHVADIAHPAKPWEVELKWSNLIFQEFFNQGDKEKSMNLPVSFLCDRETTLIPKSQVGFIKNIIMPTFNLVHALLPNTEIVMNYINQNLDKWNEEDMLEIKKKEEAQKKQEIKIAIEEDD